MYKASVAVSVAVAIAVSASAQEKPQLDLPSLASGAEGVVVATVTRVEPVFQTNEFGDRLIVSQTHLRVESVLKPGSGQPLAATDSVILEIEGGTIGDVTLTVSDLPRMERGDRAVVFLARNSRGAVVPHRRGDGILRLDGLDRVKGTALTLADIREALKQSR